MSQTIMADDRTTEIAHNGRDIDTDERIMHEFDAIHELVLAECTTCSTESSRRLLRRDYRVECCFKQPVAVNSDDWLPCVIYRRCDECGRERSHFVC